MKKILILIALISCSFFMSAQDTGNTSADNNQIRQTIQSAYVEGLQNEGDTVKINLGFHPGFELLIPQNDGQLKKYTLAEWKSKVKTDLASGKLPRKPDERVSIKFLLVDVTGIAAVAKFEFYVGNKLAYIDYQFLYKFGEDWKIVSKIFHKY